MLNTINRIIHTETCLNKTTGFMNQNYVKSFDDKAVVKK